MRIFFSTPIIEQFVYGLNYCIFDNEIFNIALNALNSIIQRATYEINPGN